jgi:hypothetical protein
MLWYLLAAFLVGWLLFGTLWFARDAKKAPEVPPAEERPHLPPEFRPLSVRDRLALREKHAWEQEIAEHREAVRG